MRKYKPKPKPMARRGRMMRAARLRAEGMSLRQIAAELQVHHSTVAADLVKWDEERAKVSDLPVGFHAPGGTESDGGSDSGSAAVIPLRRPA